MILIAPIRPPSTSQSTESGHGASDRCAFFLWMMVRHSDWSYLISAQRLHGGLMAPLPLVQRDVVVVVVFVAHARGHTSIPTDPRNNNNNNEPRRNIYVIKLWPRSRGGLRGGGGWGSAVAEGALHTRAFCNLQYNPGGIPTLPDRGIYYLHESQGWGRIIRGGPRRSINTSSVGFELPNSLSTSSITKEALQWEDGEEDSQKWGISSAKELGVC